MWVGYLWGWLVGSMVGLLLVLLNLGVDLYGS